MGVRAVCRKTVLSVGRRGTDVGSNKINQNFELTLLPISSVSLLGLLKHLEEKRIKGLGDFSFPFPTSPCWPGGVGRDGQT